MEANEILEKIAELKAITAKAEDLAFQIHAEVIAKKMEAREAMYACLGKGKDVDQVEYLAHSQEVARFEEMTMRIETATYKLTQEVIGNLNKIA